ncbi:MerR family transcriptional regulator [Lipingzhangella sp. LS1_29]|uniref:MerR family transcriptional regulator n=1 Tax=Lipingzhangella rawalii TaxID=2055835 RepID=A0ABU2H8F8_9ACTN|nr:MerR family transcriptional regulator [Lipingzhangella rawalii]MDS1271598.1 MerR family transcriptional regulator [Lipingzhangella rawalii]
MATEHMQIGTVAERTGLSLRTIRYYDEMGLVTPSARSPGGFRLYCESDVQRLLLITRMRPLEFSLEDTRRLLNILDQLDRLPVGDGEHDHRTRLLQQLSEFEEAIASRCASLREQLTQAEAFAEQLRAQSGRPSAPLM